MQLPTNYEHAKGAEIHVHLAGCHHFGVAVKAEGGFLWWVAWVFDYEDMRACGRNGEAMHQLAQRMDAGEEPSLVVPS